MRCARRSSRTRKPPAAPVLAGSHAPHPGKRPGERLRAAVAVLQRDVQKSGAAALYLPGGKREPPARDVIPDAVVEYAAEKLLQSGKRAACRPGAVLLRDIPGEVLLNVGKRGGQ